MTECTSEGCAREARAPRGWCWAHYNRWRRYGDAEGGFRQAPCSVDGCDRASRSRGMCDMHYRRLKRHGDPTVRMNTPRGICTVDQCEERAFGRGLCQRHHYADWVSHGGRAKVSATMGRRRARIAGATVRDADLTWVALLRSGDGNCYMCGQACDLSDYREVINRAGRSQQICGPSYPTLDHVIPLSRGGEHSRSNVALACMACNRTKSAKVAREAKHDDARQDARTHSQ